MMNREQGREHQIQDFKLSINRKVETYIRKGLPVEEMAQILDAQEFVGEEKSKGKAYTYFIVPSL
jgi:hypothetical protein